MKFTPNQPVATTQPRVIVDPGLPVGRHRFRLEVINERGQRSRPTDVIVTIVEQGPVPLSQPKRHRGSSSSRRRRNPPSP